MRIRDPSRPVTPVLAGLVLVLALAVGCPGETNPRTSYVTFHLQGLGYFHVPWRAEPVEPGGGETCFKYESDLIGNAVLADESTDVSDQGSDTFFRYFGDSDGAATGGCNGAFDAQFTFEGARYFLDGLMARPFPDMSEVDETDPDPHATGAFTREGGDASGPFTFWAYEYTPALPARGYPTEPQTR